MKLPQEVQNAVSEELQEATEHRDDRKSYTGRRHFPVTDEGEFVVHRSHFKKTGGCVVVEFKGSKGNKVLKRWNVKPTKS